MTKTILFISKKLTGASTRYRASAFFPLLNNAGWQTSHIDLPTNLWGYPGLLAAASKADVVVVLRKTFPLPLLKLLRRVAKVLIFDFDDAIFVRGSTGKPSRIRNNRFLNMMQYCDQCWAGNQYLGENAKRLGATTTVLPTSLEPEKYLLTTNKPTDHLDLVWIGSSSTKKYLEDALPTLEAIGQAIPDARLKIIADFSLPTTHLKTLPITWHSTTEAQELASAHIGISPLFDNPWTRGKCALKTLQYMAAGLPVIATPVGVHNDIILPGQTGIFAGNSAEWIAAIKQLQAQPQLRTQMGDAGRTRVLNEFSVTATFAKMQRDLASLCALLP